MGAMGVMGMRDGKSLRVLRCRGLKHCRTSSSTHTVRSIFSLGVYLSFCRSGYIMITISKRSRLFGLLAEVVREVRCRILD